MSNSPVGLMLSADETLFFNTVRAFAEKEIKPLVSAMDETETLHPEVLKKLFELGIMGIEIPDTHGGAGGSFFDAILAVQALAQVDPSVSVLVDVQNTLVINAISRWGSDTQKNHFFPLLAQNQVGSYCLTEAGSGSDAFALKTKAIADGPDHFLISGKKLFITNAKEAQVFLVFATIDAAAGYKGITAFLVERDFPGFSVGKKEKKLGIRASSTCEIVLDNCRVSKENILGERGKGYKIAIETLNEGRIGIAAQMLGLAEGAFAGALAYTQTREQFGKPLSHFQGVQFQLAEMGVAIESARLMVYQAARLKQHGHDFVTAAAMAKYVASTVAEKVASLSLELHGGYGFTKEFAAEKFYRDAKIGKIYEGTSNMQLQTIAKNLLETVRTSNK